MTSLTELNDLLKKIITEKKSSDDKIDRSAFLYMDPKEPNNEFAQCNTCVFWNKDNNRCSIHGPDLEVSGSATCGLYIHGEFVPEFPVEKMVTPEESGLENRKVRCENCRSFEDGKCQLFAKLNEQLPEIFKLDENVDKEGCCNANKPK